ncbi:MAG: hypothetical protein V1774_08170 [Candidatus Eisenbacteria bacterium]
MIDRHSENDPARNASGDRGCDARPDAPDAGPGNGHATLDFLIRLLRWRKRILLNTGIVAVIAVIVSLLLPNWYAAHVSILPPQEDILDLGGISGGMARAMAAIGGGGLSYSGRMTLPVWATASDLIAGILRSRRLAEQVIAEHSLIEGYRCKNMDQAREEFWRRVRVRVGPEGIVRLRVLDQDPARAAAIAASGITALDAIQRETRHAGASQVRAFIAQRLETTRRELAAAEESLRVFEERHGLLVPEEQARALVETIASVEAERLAAEVERDALVSQVGDAHPEVQRIEARLQSLAQARAALEGREGDAGATAGERRAGERAPERAGIIDLGRLPELSLQFLRHFRAVEVHEALHVLLAQMHEQYRIQEVRDTPTIQLLDPPAVPQQKDKPHRAVICIVATLLALAGGIAVAAGVESLTLRAERDPAGYARLARLLRGIGLGVLTRRG